MDPDLPVSELTPMGAYLTEGRAQARFSLVLMTVLGAVALVLTAVGVFGVISYSVSQRTREFGIRLALGEDPRQTRLSVVLGGMRLVLVSIGIGLAGSLVVTRLIAGLLYEVRPADPVTFAGIGLLLAAVALLACYLPARRATRVDPALTLRKRVTRDDIRCRLHALRGRPVIRLANLDRYYEAGPTRTYVLRRINLEIREGEFLTIMGPSGAGKSTLLSILGMLDNAWTGEYWFLDQAVHELPAKKRVELNKKYIGFVFQKYHLIDDLTVYENLEIPLSLPRHQAQGARGDRGRDARPVPDRRQEGPLSRASSPAGSSSWWASRAR